jgi:hypothetical protein
MIDRMLYAILNSVYRSQLRTFTFSAPSHLAVKTISSSSSIHLQTSLLYMSSSIACLTNCLSSCHLTISNLSSYPHVMQDGSDEPSVHCASSRSIPFSLPLFGQLLSGLSDDLQGDTQSSSLTAVLEALEGLMAMLLIVTNIDR